ncbi:MAG: hypothetical protein NWE94_00135 [Candidatus Bathyarchaeota archaeon]|nr:hypothetical protein [Candidatus Bathyarchaeota archaeon]
MSFRLGLNRVHEFSVFALMMVFVFAVFFSEIDFTYKIGIAALVFSIIFLTSIAGQVLKQQEEARQR